MTIGGRNLIIMGILACLIALTTTGISLAVYHNSGDIYLDRSRPGFLPDEDEIEQDGGEDEKEYYLDKDTVVTEEVLDEYLKALDVEIKGLDSYEEPFSEKGLSDSMLGI